MKELRKNKLSEAHFLSLRKIAYWIFATVWIFAYFVILLICMKWIRTSTPQFIESLLIKHDWLTIIYFPLVAILLLVPLYWLSARYHWFCSRVYYRIEDGGVVLSSHQTEYRLLIKDIQCVDCQIHKTAYPLVGRGTPLYHYYTLTISMPDRKIHFNSIPLRQYSHAVDFERFVAFLNESGLSVKIPILSIHDHWFVKLLMFISSRNKT